MEICTQGEIPLTDLPGGVRVRCVLYDEKLKFEIARAKTLAADA
jgi:hypothetical protein